jgi:hypothetical protein
MAVATTIQQAESTAAFLGSIGVNVHMTYTNTSYGNVSMVESDLAGRVAELVEIGVAASPAR